LLLELLDGNSDRPVPTGPIAPDELEELRGRIGAIEKKLAALEDDRPTTPPALETDDRNKFVICEVVDGRPVKYWGGDEWTNDLSAANRYQSEATLKRTLDKVAKRKRDNPEIPIRYNTIGAIVRILGGE
jgi:hypothetical protein